MDTQKIRASFLDMDIPESEDGVLLDDLLEIVVVRKGSRIYSYDYDSITTLDVALQKNRLKSA